MEVGPAFTYCTYTLMSNCNLLLVVIGGIYSWISLREDNTNFGNERLQMLHSGQLKKDKNKNNKIL